MMAPLSSVMLFLWLVCTSLVRGVQTVPENNKFQSLVKEVEEVDPATMDKWPKWLLKYQRPTPRSMQLQGIQDDIAPQQDTVQTVSASNMADSLGPSDFDPSQWKSEVTNESPPEVSHHGDQSHHQKHHQQGQQGQQPEQEQTGGQGGGYDYSQWIKQYGGGQGGGSQGGSSSGGQGSAGGQGGQGGGYDYSQWIKQYGGGQGGGAASPQSNNAMANPFANMSPKEIEEEFRKRFGGKSEKEIMDELKHQYGGNSDDGEKASKQQEKKTDPAVVKQNTKKADDDNNAKSKDDNGPSPEANNDKSMNPFAGMSEKEIQSEMSKKYEKMNPFAGMTEKEIEAEFSKKYEKLNDPEYWKNYGKEWEKENAKPASANTGASGQLKAMENQEQEQARLASEQCYGRWSDFMRQAHQEIPAQHSFASFEAWRKSASVSSTSLPSWEGVKAYAQWMQEQVQKQGEFHQQNKVDSTTLAATSSVHLGFFSVVFYLLLSLTVATCLFVGATAFRTFRKRGQYEQLDSLLMV